MGKGGIYNVQCYSRVRAVKGINRVFWVLGGIQRDFSIVTHLWGIKAKLVLRGILEDRREWIPKKKQLNVLKIMIWKIWTTPPAIWAGKKCVILLSVLNSLKYFENTINYNYYKFLAIFLPLHISSLHSSIKLVTFYPQRSWKYLFIPWPPLRMLSGDNNSCDWQSRMRTFCAKSRWHPSP